MNVMKRILLLTIVFSIFNSQFSIFNSAYAQNRLVGGDMSLIPAYETAGDRWLDEKGSVIPDLLQYVKGKGWNAVRIRLFVNPASAADPSVCQDLDYVTALSKRVKEAGMKVLLDFHYSDTWADPGQQRIPAAWTDHSNAALARQLHDYTLATIATLIAEGATPDYVQIGNEITYGLLFNTSDGKYPTDASKYAAAGYCPTWSSRYNDGVAQWKRTASLLNNGAHAVHQAFDEAGLDSTQVKIVLHSTLIGSADASMNFHRHLRTAGFTNYDVVGLSYYAFWCGKLDVLGAMLNALKRELPEKQVQIVETAWYNNYYPYTSDAKGEYTIASLNASWTANAAGMVNYLNDLTAYLKTFDQVTALYYWQPEECGNGYSKKVMNGWINRGMWQNGSSRQHTILKTASGDTPVEALARYLSSSDPNGVGSIADNSRTTGQSFDLTGRPLHRNSHGIYIRDGRKLLSK